MVCLLKELRTQQELLSDLVSDFRSLMEAKQLQSSFHGGLLPNAAEVAAAELRAPPSRCWSNRVHLQFSF